LTQPTAIWIPMVDMCYIEAKAPRLSPIGDSCGAFYYARV